MAASPQQANQKWLQNAGQAQDRWSTNLQQTQKPIVAAAIAQRATMQANFAQATGPGGVWEQNLAAVGDSGIKAAAAAKAQNYSTGIQQGSADQLAAITKIIAYENANLPTIYAMPKGTRAAAKARQNAWLDIMADARGTLGA